MAKSDNFFNLKGKIGNLIFCERNGKTYVKIYSGGFVNGKSHQHPNTKRAQNEFKEVSTFVKNLRIALIPFIYKQKDGTFYNQLVSLFSKVRNTAPDKKLYTAFKEGYGLYILKNKALNKHSKLNGRDCYYDINTNEVHIYPTILHQIIELFPSATLEIHLAWLIINPTLDVKLQDIQTAYLPISEIDLKQPIPFKLEHKNLEKDHLGFPILSIAVVSQPTSDGKLYHPYAYNFVTIL